MEAVVDTARQAADRGEPPGAIRPIAGWGLERGVDEAVGADRRDHSGHVGHLHAHRRHVAARDDARWLRGKQRATPHSAREHNLEPCVKDVCV